MKKVSVFIGKNMAWIVLIIAALALFLPETCLWIQTKQKTVIVERQTGVPGPLRRPK